MKSSEATAVSPAPPQKESLLTLEQWQQLALEFPQHEPTRRMAVELLIRWGKLDEAITEATAMCTTRSMFASGKVLLADVEWLRNRRSEARRHLEDAIRAAPNDAAVLSAICQFYFQAKMWDDAEIALREWEHREPQNEVAICNLALVLERRGATLEALSRYRRVIEINPHSRLALRRIELTSQLAGITPGQDSQSRTSP